MADELAKNDTITLLILGASGDLTRRLLLPGLGTLLTVEPERKVRVIGSSRDEISDEQWREKVVAAFTEAGTPSKLIKSVSSKSRYIAADVLDPQSLAALIAEVGDGPLVIFFALPPAVTMKCCELLTDVKLPSVTRLALEKPFGDSLASAKKFNRLLQRVVPERDVYRIDHFLGVNTVLNIIGLRFANRIFQPVWNATHIERVEIVYDEALALEGRAGYYDHAGALRDMIQSHLLQVLAVFAMDDLPRLASRDLRDAKSQVLRATRVWGSNAARASKRARYTAGTIDGRKIPDYTKEPGVDPSRKTETLAQVTLEINNNRWAGVPFVLRSGKGMGTATKEIRVRFRPVRHVPSGFAGAREPDVLVIQLRPGAVELTVTMNAEGDPLDLERKALSATLAVPRMRPYGEILGQIFDGRQFLSVSADAAEECWRIVEPVIKAFEEDRVAMAEYPAGGQGPSSWLDDIGQERGSKRSDSRAKTAKAQ